MSLQSTALIEKNKSNFMDFRQLYLDTSTSMSRLVTKRYSTSFSMAIILLSEPVKTNIYNIYGFVRIPDELVDSLRPRDCKKQLQTYFDQTYDALNTGTSSNPIIHAFANTAIKYSIPKDIIKPFFDSMLSDITKKKYTTDQYKQYIYGSAEVVGLMCLMVFVGGNRDQYKKLKPSASALGSAFQKINFLRDISSDNISLGRVYFPDINIKRLTETDKQYIEADIQKDLTTAKQMIKVLPTSSRYGVRLAYYYYNSLYRKIVRTSPQELLRARIRINNFHKFLLFVLCSIQKLLRV